MRSTARLTIVGLASLLLAAGCAAANTGSGSGTGTTPAPNSTEVALPIATQAALRKALTSARTEFDFPGAQVGVWAPNGTWVGVVGTAGPGQQRPPQRHDRTRIGSITKTFTVTAILQLAETDDLSLDDKIGKYVAGLPNGTTATLRNLADMTSGIPTYTADKKLVSKYFDDPTRVWQPESLVNAIKGDKPDFPAGTRFEYSDTNTVLLGMVIEKVTGKPIEAVFREGLYDPLDLNETNFPGPSAEMTDPHLSGVTRQGNPPNKLKDATDWSPTFSFTAGEIVSTLDDLHTWAVALNTGEGLLEPETQQMRLDSLKTKVPPNKPNHAYGMGFGITDGWIGHVGAMPGFNTSMQYNPTTQTTMVVMVNSDVPHNGQNPADAIFAAMAPILAPVTPASASASAS